MYEAISSSRDRGLMLFYMKGDVEANNREIGAMKRREEALSMEAESMSQTHASRMQQAKEQHEKERDVLRKQLQGQIIEVRFIDVHCCVMEA